MVDVGGLLVDAVQAASRMTGRRVVTVKMDEWLYERLSEAARRMGMHKAEVLRAALYVFTRLLEEDAPKRRLYRCPLCGETMNLQALRRHVLGHLEAARVDGAWRCPICGRTYRDLDQLKIHLFKSGDEAHMLLWAVTASAWSNAKHLKRRLLEKLVVSHVQGR